MILSSVVRYIATGLLLDIDYSSLSLRLYILIQTNQHRPTIPEPSLPKDLLTKFHPTLKFIASLITAPVHPRATSPYTPPNNHRTGTANTRPETLYIPDKAILRELMPRLIIRPGYTIAPLNSSGRKSTREEYYICPMSPRRTIFTLAQCCIKLPERVNTRQCHSNPSQNMPCGW